jgi:predicted RND superfamily exporter protein
VARIGQKRQAAGENAAQHLRNHEAADQYESDSQAATAGLPKFRRMIVAVARVIIMIVLPTMVMTLLLAMVVPSVRVVILVLLVIGCHADVYKISHRLSRLPLTQPPIRDLASKWPR